MGNNSTIDAVAKLDDIIRNPGLRKNFKDHPDQTMHEAGADPVHVPAEVWQTVTQMSIEELTAIADLGVALSDTEWLHGKIAWHHVV